ncbi:MAG: DUF6089 family protein [Bacteroidia bacterium]
MKNNFVPSGYPVAGNYFTVYLLIIFAIFKQGNSFAQMKRLNQYEIISGAGPTNFLGELGGANNIGTHFFRDFNLSSSRYCANAGIRYFLSQYVACKSMLSFAMVSGSDNLTNEKCRHNRNLNFRSPIAELSLQGEIYFAEVRKTNRSKRAGLMFYKKKKRLSPYLFSGIGIFYYSPQAMYNGKWYNLRELHTEGQGLPGGARPYNNFNICIPVGAGLKYKFNGRLALGIELGFRKTFTDYLDDVSTTYYDKNILAKKYGAVSAALSDPGLGDIPGATNASFQRGNSKYKDAYMFLSFNVSYKLLFRNGMRVRF